MLQTIEIKSLQSKKERDFKLRLMYESDVNLIADFLGRLSPSTLWLRYFLPYPALSSEAINREIVRLNKISNSTGLVLVATGRVEGKEEIIGVGELIPNEVTAELALTLRDDFQGEGIGTAMTMELVQLATRQGITTLQAETLSHNRTVLHLWSKAGLPYSFRSHRDITTMLMWLEC